MTMTQSPQPGNFWKQLHAPRTRFLILTAGSLAMIQLLIMGNIFIAAMLAIAGGYLYPYFYWKQITRFERFCQSRRINPTAAVAVLGLVAVFGASLVGPIEPAQAQFFTKTENWMNSAIPGIPQDLVKIIFNVLRLMFVIYLGISLVKVVQAARDGEDWATLARTPGIVLVAVTLGDVLGGLITGAK